MAGAARTMVCDGTGLFDDLDAEWPAAQALRKTAGSSRRVCCAVLFVALLLADYLSACGSTWRKVRHDCSLRRVSHHYRRRSCYRLESLARQRSGPDCAYACERPGT